MKRVKNLFKMQIDISEHKAQLKKNIDMKQKRLIFSDINHVSIKREYNERLEQAQLRSTIDDIFQISNKEIELISKIFHCLNGDMT